VTGPRLEDGAVARSCTGGTCAEHVRDRLSLPGLGYTTVMEAAVAPLGRTARARELDDTPIIDAGFFVLLGNDDYLLRQLAAGEAARAHDYRCVAPGTTRAYAIKIVEPGGVAAWKGVGDRRNVSGLDDTLGSSKWRPNVPREHPGDARWGRQQLWRCRTRCTSIATTLGQPGNAATTLESMRALAGQRATSRICNSTATAERRARGGRRRHAR